MLKSVKSSEDAIKIYTQTSKLLSFGGFHLTKWISNKRDVLDAIPQSELMKDLKNIDFETEKLPVERALGMQWNVENDKFLYNINIMDKPSTRRGMLSIISSIYDPLGFVSPLILRAKIILQNLCRKKLGWDENIPAEDLIDWRKWLTELPTIEQFSIERSIKPANFSDASEVGYGAVTYLRSMNKEGNIHCSFILGKSRLTPIKPVTIPRLELTAATVAVKLDKMVRRELDISIDKSYFWTDSTSVLKYIKNENKRFQTFVANRLAVIHDGTNPDQWFYIDKVLNPADDASRGLTAVQLINSARWIRGPEFLWKSDSYCEDTLQPIFDISEDDPEVKKSMQSHAMNVGEAKGITEFIFSKYSVWNQLKKTVAWLLRYKHWLHLKVQRDEEALKSVKKGRMTVEEMRQAEHTIVLCVQREQYGKDIKKLNSLRKLDPVYKGDLLCVGGRLKHLPTRFDDLKYPAILPKRHHVVDLIIKHYHLQSGHFGVEYVLSQIREKYWIVKARVPVRRVINSCLDCKR